MNTLAIEARPPSLPEALHRYLSNGHHDEGEVTTTDRYVEAGGKLCTPAAMDALFVLLPSVHRKLRETGASGRFRQSMDILLAYFSEMRSERRAPSPALREATFALLYFLKGSDRISDSLPDVGLVDDALLAQCVIDRNAAALRIHWQQHRRAWPQS